MTICIEYNAIGGGGNDYCDHHQVTLSLFRSEEEAAQFYAGKGGRLTAEAILDGLVNDVMT